MAAFAAITMTILFGLTATAGENENGGLEYSRDVKPLLKTKCYSCHGALRQEAGLRLDTASMIRSGGDSGPAIVAGDSTSSLLVERVLAHQSERMPPEGEALSQDQVTLLKHWIDRGATAPENEAPPPDPNTHWAFQPLRVVEPPRTAPHPIDAFVDRRRSRAGISSAPPAGAVTLIRRMFLDLHGLPPEPMQINHWSERFRQDLSASTALIDQLLASPRYGERWAQHWLDLVRYADTHGYEVNTPRENAWPYRDYVIAAFNEDKPYDRFISEQLAGDQFGADAATGFMVAAAALLPGQIGKDDASKRLARQDELDEIIIGTSATFLGMTVGCARCHDHKFDPISQEDYYAMQAFFAGVQFGERDVNDERARDRLVAARDLQPRIDDLQQQLDEFQPVSFRGRTMIIDDEDLDRVTLLKTKRGHGVNPPGTNQGYRDDVGDSHRVGNLSRGRYTWWTNESGADVFTWDPTVKGRFRLWVSWGVHGSGVHTRDARYVLDRDGDLSTRNDQTEIAVADQYRFADPANGEAGETEKKPLWSGLKNTGIHEFTPATRLILRCGETNSGVTADVIVLQEVAAAAGQGIVQKPTASLQPRLRAAVNARKNIERFPPIEAQHVRFTSLKTIDDNKHQPCLDELEVFTAGEKPVNIALSSRGSIATSSGDYADPGRHELKHVNDGRYGNDRSWISNEHGRGWVQLEFPRVFEIDRIVWGRDRETKFKDRLPVQYRIEVSMDGTRWTTVASSTDRVPIGTPHNDRYALLRRGGEVEDAGKADSITTQLQQLRTRQTNLRKPRKVFAGIFRQPESTFVLRRGDPEQPVKEIAPQTLKAIGSLSLSPMTPEPDRRKRLADWITSADNPLTARVMTNRIWQYHFGVGLVETASDFGLNGMAPSHPDLLDWLSGEFVRSGWSVKHLHRLIMSSQTYQLSSVWSGNPKQHPAEHDADNRLLWRFPSRRLEAEAIRDCILQVSGRLNLQTGGPGFNFFQTRGGLTGFPPVEQFGADGMRRMIYAHKIRMERVPVFGAFDCPDAGLPTPRRSQSTTAIQALNLLNSPFVVAQADAFAERVETKAGSSTDRQIELAFRLALGRSPGADELEQVRSVVAEHGVAPLCRALFNSSEFLFIP